MAIDSEILQPTPAVIKSLQSFLQADSSILSLDNLFASYPILVFPASVSNCACTASSADESAQSIPQQERTAHIQRHLEL